MMSERVVVDPITRIEGHLRIEAETDASGNIIGASSAGTMVRGIELILKGRDPRDAWAYAQRICGVCTLVHGIASVRSVENALNYQIPANAQLIRNLMIAAQYVHDHVMHFYHLHALDWVDVVSALKADPKATSALAQSLSKWPKSSPGYFSDVQKKIKDFVESGQLGIFTNGYWGHPAYKLPPEANLMAVAHYLEALSWQREVVKIHTIFGGKNPHPNFLVGGAPSPISGVSGDMGATALNILGLQEVSNTITKMMDFVDNVYVPDTIAIAGFYKDWFKRGAGVRNFMTFGDMPETSMDDPSSYFIPGGVILDRNLSKIHPLDLNDPEQVKEFIAHSYYDYSAGKEAGLHPYDGETNLNYTGPKPPYDFLDIENSYSWMKSPRWKGQPMEVGPLARVLMLYASGHEPTQNLTNSVLKKLDVPIDALYSTLGRTAARTLETKLIGDKMQSWLGKLIGNIKAGDLSVHNTEFWEPSSWPSEARGVGFMEAPRGALAHWIVIKDEKIANYQAVVPSTWNAGPRDVDGQDGPYEAALTDNHQLHDPKQPIEILRTIHSFDPCIACAVHVTDPEGDELVKVKVR
ncbi:MAG: nickel-dependent hydrogenase large subunit [Gammaproteobacteria bacterium]|nr:nickel-dependent hydrogenase large subunit [Gammaproteobacteria bacterium]MBT3724893.1 nickel-dependent hydrogenase large subunit [Gammaproteobacteria bacterium]MBT4076620.1 nickel-dependent hydrogenase large subunit [Gammaproteobacteria bacterium]MBT4192967.1 nickel-dependent hydrogenase large subunit [Gammaproteobacteria bacterium]MBT4450880.1 nickel-dependent hydrogenase large subunit [Gammaproteobacteria bacterium]